MLSATAGSITNLRELITIITGNLDPWIADGVRTFSDRFKHQRRHGLAAIGLKVWRRNFSIIAGKVRDQLVESGHDMDVARDA